MSTDRTNFQSRIWKDVADPQDPFTASESHCLGYNVFEQLVNKASLTEYMLLLFIEEKPSIEQVQMFDSLAVAIANKGPRDPAIRAAMNSGVGGAPGAAYLISALAVGAGEYGGAHEIGFLVDFYHSNGLNLESWQELLKNPNQNRAREDIWDPFEHMPGFNQHGVSTPKTLKSLLKRLNRVGELPAITWLIQNRESLENIVGYPISISLIVATVFYELGLSREKAELLYLLLILPGAAVHALEAKKQGWKQFPFFGQSIELEDDPGKKGELPELKGTSL